MIGLTRSESAVYQILWCGSVGEIPAILTAFLISFFPIVV